MVLLQVRLLRQASIFNGLRRLEHQQLQFNINAALFRGSSYSSERPNEKANVGPPPPITTPGAFSQPAAPPPKAASNNETGEARLAKRNTESLVPVACPPKQKLSRQAVRENVKGYVFTRYFDYVKNYDKVLEKNFPSAVKAYRIFFDGVKDFFADMKHYLKVTRILYDSSQGLKALNRKELELYMQMPRDMWKVAPALIGCSLPVVGYAVFPLVFMYPRTFLTSHFWTWQQRMDFQQLQLQERLKTNRPVLRCLQSKLQVSRKHEKYIVLQNILGLLGSGFHPPVSSILDMKDIFAKSPYSLMSLSGKHLKLLHEVHGLTGMLFKRHRLTEHAFLVHHMDLAIMREGGVHNMHQEALRYACHLRGLNAIDLRNDEMVEWLRNWIKVSTSIREEHISLFLHLPLFLGYNHPNNWQLIYGKK